MKRIVVVGGGILGAATTFELAKRGAEVIVIDREDRGQATKAAAGIICPWNSQRRNKKWYLLAREGAKYYPSLVNDLHNYHSLNTGYKKVGALSLHSDIAKLEAMKERTLKRKIDAPEIGDIDILSSSEAQSLFPLLAPGYMSLHISGAARVNGWALRNALMEASKQLGASFIHSSCTLLKEGNTIKGVKLSDNTSIYADEVVIAAGVWANELLEPLHLAFDVKAQKGQILHIQLKDIQCSNWPVVMPPHDQYLLTLEDNTIVIGATHENTTELSPHVTIEGIKEIIDKALLFAPGLLEGIWREVKVGFRPFTNDFLPVFGRVKHYEGITLANGLGASGLTMGPFIGQQLAKFLLHSESDIDFSPYSIDSSIQER
ncbi:FAD-dependent oxidoreductase [Niallia circulans]|uniref:NAD(P)/FAD-dependent oxidoreductase n=1 Tax=Niallia circulans TaxID=1397 RepID=UPI000BA7874A|nr:FAD-binding oxidoreductase [Niallia circulans]PAD89815.1 FAD-dependent oxidoreductase [Niallia circulans]